VKLPVSLKLVAKRLDTVSPVADALMRVVCPDTPRVPATPRVKAGEEEPIPTLPFARTLKSDAPLDEATVRTGIVEDAP
jgi:hypothetical protein